MNAIEHDTRSGTFSSFYRWFLLWLVFVLATGNVTAFVVPGTANWDGGQAGPMVRSSTAGGEYQINGVSAQITFVRTSGTDEAPSGRILVTASGTGGWYSAGSGTGSNTSVVRVHVQTFNGSVWAAYETAIVVGTTGLVPMSSFGNISAQSGSLGSTPAIKAFGKTGTAVRKIRIRWYGSGEGQEGPWREYTFGSQHNLTLKLPANDTEFSKTYTLTQDGQVVASYEVPPGTNASTGIVEVPSNGTVTATETIYGVSYDEVGNLVKDPTGSITRSAGSATPRSEGDETETPETTVSPKKPVPGTTVEPDLQPITWDPITTDGVAGATGGVTNMTFRQGITALAAAVGRAQSSGSTGGGGTTVDMSGVTSRIDTTNTKLTGIDTQLDTANMTLSQITENSEAMKQLVEEEKAIRDAQVAGAQAQMPEMLTRAAAKADEAIALFPVPPERSYALQKTAPEFTISSGLFRGGNGAMISMNVDPFADGRFLEIANWLRSALLWLCVMLFGFFCSQDVNQMVQTLATARQAKGQSYVEGGVVVAGGGSHTPAALIAAGFITVIAAVAIIAVVVYATKDSGSGSLLDMMGIDPLQGMPAKAAWLLDQFVPVVAMITYFAGRLVWRMTAQAAVMGAAAGIRWIVP